MKYRRTFTEWLEEIDSRKLMPPFEYLIKMQEQGIRDELIRHKNKWENLFTSKVPIV